MSLDCIPCFLRQALKASRIAGADEDTQKKILSKLSALIPELLSKDTPPEAGKEVYQIVSDLTGNKDPFKAIKEESNKFALSLCPGLEIKLTNSKDKIFSAIKLAIAGNTIDYGAPNSFNIKEEMENCLKKNFAIFDYPEFLQALNNAKSILYIGDNAGEAVFDRILIEQLGKKVVYAVRDKPIINDALISDAYACGINKVAEVISSGSDAPGTIPNLCSPEFLKIYNSSSLIISKGQGNFETLSEEKKPIFFLFKAKCSVIAKEVGCKVNDLILKSNL